MKFLGWILSVLLFFRIEVFCFFKNFTFLQWIILLSVSCLCVYFIRRKIIIFARKIKDFSLNRYRKNLGKWARENDSEVIAKSFVFQLEQNVSLKISCILLSIGIFNYCPSLMTNSTAAAFFLGTLIVYLFVTLAFKKEAVILISGMYFLMAVSFYVMAFFSYYSDVNLFQTIPFDLVYFLNIDISMLTQTANKLFFFTTPLIILSLLFFILSSIIMKYCLKLIFTIFLKVARLSNPV